MDKNNKQKKEFDYKPLINFLFVSLFIIIPFVLIWLFGTDDFYNQQIKSLTWQIISPLLISVVAIGVNFLFYYLKIVSSKSFTIGIPLIIMFIFMFYSFYIPEEKFKYGLKSKLALRITLTLIIVSITTLLTHMIISKIEDKKEFLINKQKKELEQQFKNEEE